MIIEDESIFKAKEKQYIDSVILGGDIAFFWSPNQVKNDGKPFLYHTLIHRDTHQIHSHHAAFFTELATKFIKKHKLNFRGFSRGSINLTFPIKEKGTPHRDHDFSHQQIIMYLNKSKGGSTVILSDKQKIIKTIEPKQFKMVSFDGSYLHYQNYPNKGRRVAAVITFI